MPKKKYDNIKLMEWHNIHPWYIPEVIWKHVFKFVILRAFKVRFYYADGSYKAYNLNKSRFVNYRIKRGVEKGW
jgi:hypothetical protein